MVDAGTFFSIGFLLVAVGIIVIVLAIIIASTRGTSKDGEESKVRGGGVIMIGPIPIIFGSDKKMTKGILALALALTVAALVFLVVYWWVLK